MPFPDESGAVTGILEEMSQRGLGGCKSFVKVVVGDHPLQTYSLLVPACHEGDACWRTDRCCRVAVRQPDALSGQSIDVRGSGIAGAIAARIAIPEIVHEEDDNVGTARSSAGRAAAEHHKR